MAFTPSTDYTSPWNVSVRRIFDACSIKSYPGLPPSGVKMRCRGMLNGPSDGPYRTSNDAGFPSRLGTGPRQLETRISIIKIVVYSHVKHAMRLAQRHIIGTRGFKVGDSRESRWTKDFRKISRASCVSPRSLLRIASVPDSAPAYLYRPITETGTGSPHSLVTEGPDALQSHNLDFRQWASTLRRPRRVCKRTRT